ncbi:MAG: hypothetical protein IKT13_06090 [Paludibacteraceae bacterium]|nr:hypothetical protein [Paludibacteraceae bacterium]
MIKYRYTYLHSYAEGDTVRAENVIWLMQAPEDQSAAPIQFYHQTGKSGLPMVGPRSRQQVPELTYTYYVIPDTVNNLPIHHDHWGYYRWYIYKQGANTGKGIVNNWDWTTMPTNTQTPPQPFGQLNPINSQWSRGLFEFSSKLTPGTATAIPAVQLNTTKLGGSAINFDDTLAVDISAYTDTLCTGHYSTSSLSSLTEPTLSYRQLFAMRPAKESADLMATCRTADNTYLQDEDCFAPINRPFILQPTSPYKTENNVDEGNLQYVYYYNPNPTDTIDTYMGLKNGAGTGDTLHINKGYAYNRVGLSKQTGRKRWHARLMSADEVLALKNGDTKTILLVNPRKDGGYILGGNGDKKKEYKQDVITSSTNADELRQHIEDNILNATGFDYATSYYPLTLTKTGTNTITLRNNLIDDDLCAHVSVTIPILGTFGEGVDWYNTTWLGSSSTSIIISSHSSASPDDLGGKAINGVGSALLKMYMSITALNSTYQGYLTAWSTRKPLFGSRYYYQTNAHLDGLNATEAGGSNTINQGWCFYEISLEDESFNHKEWGKWQRKVSDGDWQDLDDGWTGTELDGGALQTAYNGTNGEVVEYRLITQHFLLAHFAVTMRPVNTQGPSTTAIISEADIEQDYDVIASFGLEEDLGAPGTQEMVAAYHPLQFNHTQFAYHYPVGNGDHQIPASQRVTGSDLLPTKGEYCIINKFEKAGDSNYDVVEAGGGAEHGWMFCYNRAPKPLVFIDFEYPKPACTDQDLMLVSNFCQPNKVSQENPHVKADFYGHMPGRPADEWVKIFTYLTSNFNEAGQWYQLALPLRWSDIGSFDKYRCVGTVSAAEGAGSYLLFDRFRLLAKKNPMTSFQKRTTCVDANDSIYILSRVDYTDSELPAGRVICYQFQRWDNTANGGAGGYVPMIASDYDSGTGTYTCRPLNTTEVYPGYYKVGMSREEAVTNPAFKSAVLNSDYGMIVIPEDGYNPETSDVSPSLARVAAINRIQQILGGDRSSYYNETGRIKTYSDIMTATTFRFGGHGKFYVNEGTNEAPHWVMYIIVRVKASDSDNGSFRIAMNTVEAVDQKPNFSDASCSNERIVRVQGSVDMLVDGDDGWPNKTREELEATDALIPANTSVTLGLRYNAPADAKTGTTTACRFDLLRAFDFMRGYTEMTPEQQAAADIKWINIYGCTPGDFQEAMNVFRAEDIHNPNRNVTDWNDVTKESFCWIDGYDCAKADSMYNLLNRLIVRDRLFEIGLSSRDVYLANKQDIYFYMRPIAASGSYTKLLTSPERDTIVEGIICNAALWVELHSDESPDSLRFGYDKKFGDSYMVPVIRATKTDANTALTVRVAAISDGAVIGWDSTYVVETNDPSWNPATHTFRYTQDRIVQERLYSGYYQQGQIVTFRPIDAAHITRLNRTDCECLNYDATGTTYDPTNPRAKNTAGTNVFVRPEDDPINGCNEWHILPQTSDPDPKKHIPGYQVPNNFTLKAGYWYKFKTAFFNTGTSIPYNLGDNPSGANTAYFILAVVPDTVRWTPHYDDRTNYWNDDNNWTAIVNGADFNGSLATVPLEESRTIIEPLADQSLLPVVNYDSLGLLEWGFKTATCKDILFKHHSQILGQEKLTYTGKAFIDVPIMTANWMTFSPALKDVYSGDIYVPRRAGEAENSDINNPYDPDFAPAPFDDGSGWSKDYNRTAPYVFYQAYYNSTVPYAFQNTDLEGNPLTTTTKTPKNSAEWVKTNVLDTLLQPGHAVALLGYGPVATDAKDSMLVVRLPKQETSYSYITKSYTQGTSVTLDRPTFNDITANLAYDKATLGNQEGITYSLTNEIPSNIFFFGNPTMSLIDLYKLCEDNVGKLEYIEGASNTYKFTTYNMKNGSTYAPVYVDAPGKYFIAPQRAVGLIANDASKKLDVILKPTAMVALSAGGELIQNLKPTKSESPSPVPLRQMTVDQAPVSKDKLLYISASNETNRGLYKSYVTLGESVTATSGYRKGEDALSLASGLDYFNTQAFATPLSMYTIAGNEALMLDMRDTLKSAPLVFATLEDKVNSKGKQIYTYSDITILSFATEGNWDKPLYLYDALMNDSIMILDGMQIAVQTPQSDQIRYFINGGPMKFENADPGVATGVEEAVSNKRLTVSGRTSIYDLLGRKLMTLGEYDLLHNVQLPTGVYIIQRGNQTERKLIK